MCFMQSCIETKHWFLEWENWAHHNRFGDCPGKAGYLRKWRRQKSRPHREVGVHKRASRFIPFGLHVPRRSQTRFQRERVLRLSSSISLRVEWSNQKGRPCFIHLEVASILYFIICIFYPFIYSFIWRSSLDE